MSECYTISNLEHGYSLNIDVNIDNSDWKKDFPKLDDFLVTISNKLFNKLALTKYSDNIEFSVMLTDDDSIQKLNLEYRGKNYPTNSLSFPTQDKSIKNISDHNFSHGILGDLVFSYQKILDEAIQQKKKLEDHFAHLLIHGLLHLLGYDHNTEDEAMEMEGIEVDILSLFKIKSPYEVSH